MAMPSRPLQDDRAYDACSSLEVDERDFKYAMVSSEHGRKKH
jgi:hypothetical protein